jgi:hypothetical protein
MGKIAIRHRQVLITGGFGNASDCQGNAVQAQSTADLYDPATGSFKKTGSMSFPRGGHTATLLTNGKVLVAGGGNQGGRGNGLG